MAKFEKGKSGNPSGRPKVPTNVREAARAYTEDAIRTLAEIMLSTSAPEAARVMASEKLLNRGWGMPAQPHDGDGEGGAIQHSLEVRFVRAKIGNAEEDV